MLAALINALGRPRLLALTATASPRVRREIVRALDMRDPAVIVRDFDRPNIGLGSQLAADAAAAESQVLRNLLEQPAEQNTSLTRPLLQVLTEQRISFAPTAMGLRHIEQTNAGVNDIEAPCPINYPEFAKFAARRRLSPR